MSVRRSTPVPSVLITGTTSGVGRALLEHYDHAGSAVISVNRRRVPQLESRHPRVRFEHADVRSPEAVEALFDRLVRDRQLPTVLILNAGINRVDNDETFQLPSFREVVDTNLYGVLAFVAALTRLPPGPVARHVVAISSMANYVGNPYGLGYHASKRALTSCFDVWSQMYSGSDLVFQQVMLGPVPTTIYDMGEHFPAWVRRTKDAFSGSLDGAVQAITQLAQTRKKKLVYPKRAVPLYVGMYLGQSLVPGLFRGRKTLNAQPRRPVPKSE